MFIRYILYLPLNLLVAFIALCLAPFLPAFATSENVLPKWLSWFQTPDASLDGDSGWMREFKLPKTIQRNEFNGYYKIKILR